MISIQVNVTDGASPALAAMISALTGPQATQLNEAGGLAARNAATKYHRDLEARDGWRGRRYLGQNSRSGSFGAAVSQRWTMLDANATGATISNDAPFYRHKVSGGTIKPKRAKFLTIPLIPEARGVLASDYQQNSGKKLFRPKGKNVLMESTGKGTVRAVYALVASITQGPWKGALPPADVIAEAYTAQYRATLLQKIK